MPQSNQDSSDSISKASSQSTSSTLASGSLGSGSGNGNGNGNEYGDVTLSGFGRVKSYYPNVYSQLQRMQRDANVISVPYDVPALDRRSHEKPWWKSKIIRLIGSFMVGIMCITLVVGLVIIRIEMKDPLNPVSGLAVAASTSDLKKQETSANSLAPIKRSTRNQSEAIDDLDSQARLLLLNDDDQSTRTTDRSIHVPIQVVIDPRLAPLPSPSQGLNQVNVSTNQTTLETSPSELHPSTTITGTARRKHRIKVTTSKPISKRYVIEMDIKVVPQD